MRHVERTAQAPTSLSKPNNNGDTELKRAQVHYRSETTSFPFKKYKELDVKNALEAMFHRKCAYCETLYGASGPFDVEHYRPKGAIEGEDDHPGYWWLAMVWNNLLPSCIDCNRKRRQILVKEGDDLNLLHSFTKKPKTSGGKKDSFPISGVRAQAEDTGATLVAEGALLLDPTKDVPLEHLDYSLEHICLVHPVNVDNEEGTAKEPSSKGVASIGVYGLNRLALVQARTQVIRQMEFLGNLAREIFTLADELAERLDTQPDRQLSEIETKMRQMGALILDELNNCTKPDMPYSTIATLWLENFKSKLG